MTSDFLAVSALFVVFFGQLFLLAGLVLGIIALAKKTRQLTMAIIGTLGWALALLSYAALALADKLFF